VSASLLSFTPAAKPSPHRYRGQWKVLREEESARRYCAAAISLVSFCLRAFALPPGEVPIRFTDTQQAALRVYKEHLEDSHAASDNDVDIFEETLSRVLFRERNVEISLAGRLSCPVQCYIALLSLRRTGEFVKPSLVTQPISRLLYLSRSVALRIALRHRGDSESFMR
jgi:hypothetical protein